MRRRPVRSPDLLHVHATIGAQRALKEELVPPNPMGALDELQSKLRLDPRAYVLTDVVRAALKQPRKELSDHDLKVVKDSVKTAMSGGFRQVFGWFGTGAQEHWADSIVLGIATSREGAVDTDWLFKLKLAVYRELGIDTVDVATPARTSDIVGHKDNT